ncbi:hypothetical protein HELRODRAFT_153237, partial [Helobdella robusta]|uniref:mRNA m(6)A methyltransferase n=1 Tax=Helobdella robusta TaxID=6412 RepID=T1EL14_HELRO
CHRIRTQIYYTSRKPDKIYGIIERLSTGSRKIELFGRLHNVRPNWVTITHQLPNIMIVDPKMKEAFSNSFPNGN